MYRSKLRLEPWGLRPLKPSPALSKLRLRRYATYGSKLRLEPWGFEPQTSSMPLRRSTN